ncbi:uncharacterized protein LOC111319366 [Stylophora pistillata]|nr:uncharacterized protein LOC111319366 [Stylophora pistillata]
MKSEEELKSVLVKNLGLPYGQAFKFSRNWFQKYHKHKGATIIHRQKESKNVCGSTVKINTGDGSWGHTGTSKNQTEESKSYHGPNKILNLAEDQDKSTALTFDKDDISEMQKGNGNLSINSLMMEKGAVVQDRPFNDPEEPVTSQWLKFKQDSGVQKACQNANTDAGFEVLKEGI